MVFRFGRDFWGHFARLMSVVSTVILNLALLAYSFKGAGLFLSMFLPFSPWVCSLIMLAVTVLYTLESGFYGVIFSDIFQSICIWIGVGFIVVLAVMKISGAGDLGALDQSARRRCSSPIMSTRSSSMAICRESKAPGLSFKDLKEAVEWAKSKLHITQF